MNIDFNAALDAGMSPENIMKMVEKQLKETEIKRQEEKEAKIKEEQERKDREARSATKEQFKIEGRAYAINALIAYSYAFDLIDEDEDFKQEDVNRLEELLKKIEDMIPLYIKMIELQDKFDNDLFKGLF